MTDFLRDWMPAIALVLGSAGGILAAKWNRKSQAEANNLTGSGQIFTHQSTLLQDVQEERDRAVRERDTEREANKRDIGTLRSEFETFKASVEETFSGYREYIYGLRGQVHDLGGVPIKWPETLQK
ncbi:putative nucleic acid-binding Zn-ribbon protein [Arthrobacter pascens]|uniref:hypothetical protein n=1 Tax=Arthrobacter pascens TaxID=1677 RepID=UPI0027926998|nr:hypothetical protein [Arthrobacter pascens]MDQ0679095.1 putative nucleic acid-binding Zn-ribbon protein [Arthrobacter pascens]